MQSQDAGGSVGCGDGDARLQPDSSLTHPQAHMHTRAHAHPPTAHAHTVMPQSNILTRVDGVVGRWWLGGPVERGDGDARLLTVQVPHIQPTDPPGCCGRTTDQVSHSHGAATRSTHTKIFSHNTVDARRIRSRTVMVLQQGQRIPRYAHITLWTHNGSGLARSWCCNKVNAYQDILS